MTMIEIAPLVWTATSEGLMARTLIGDYGIRLCAVPTRQAALGGFSLTLHRSKPDGLSVPIATLTGNLFSTPGQAMDAAQEHYAEALQGAVGYRRPETSTAYSLPSRQFTPASGLSRASLEYLAGLSEVQPETLEDDLELLRAEVRR